MAGLVTKGNWRRDLIALGPSTYIGLVLIMSGVGKILGQEIPGQMEFVDLLLKSLWTPTMAHLIADVLPVGEIILGVVLLLGIFTRIVAGLCIPLIIGFMASNSVAISRGMGDFPSWLFRDMGGAFRDDDASAGNGIRCCALNSGCDNIGISS